MDIAITVEERWLSDVRRRVEGARWPPRRRTEPPTIYRIPSHIRDADPKSYDPKFVSLGPYHSDYARLKAVDELKWLYLKDFLSRNPDKDLADYVRDVKALQDRALGAYSEPLQMEGTKFVEMLLLDGCFVVELLIKRADQKSRQRGAKPGEEDDGTVEVDPIRGGTTWAFALVVQDMLMLENQLPFFVLQRLFDSVSSTMNFSLTDLAIDFFADKLPENTARSSMAPTKFHHLLHLYHYYFLNVEQREDDQRTICQRLYRVLKNFPSLIWRSLRFLIKAPCLYLMKLLCCGSEHAVSTTDLIPCATELAEAGIKFKKKEGTSVVDITFEDGDMEIPQLHIYDETNSLFRNMIAFEQLYPDPKGDVVGSSVTSYAAVMEAMINTAGDVALLRRDGVIVNELGDEDEAAMLFSRLCKEVAVFKPEERHVKLIDKVNEHCSSNINRWRAKLNRDYFGNPWAIISVAAAFFLLLLTVAQTVFTILSYVHPPN